MTCKSLAVSGNLALKKGKVVVLFAQCFGSEGLRVEALHEVDGNILEVQTATADGTLSVKIPYHAITGLQYQT